MRIAANLGVLDEVELVVPCIEHLRSIGVDLIVVTDLGSVDGTELLLRDLAAAPDIRLIQYARDEDPWGYQERMFEQTAADPSVDRVLALDADEFWLPESGDLKQTAALADADFLSVTRLNIPLVLGGPPLPTTIPPERYDALYLLARPTDGSPLRTGADATLPWIVTRVLPKVIANPKAIRGLQLGGHGVVFDEHRPPRGHVPEDLVIAHLPFSTELRFRRKLANIARTMPHFGHHLGPGQAWHWRRWIEVAATGHLAEEFQRQALTPEQFGAALADGTIRSARQWLAP
jgi:hypothetical protein